VAYSESETTHGAWGREGRGFDSSFKHVTRVPQIDVDLNRYTHHDARVNMYTCIERIYVCIHIYTRTSRLQMYISHTYMQHTHICRLQMYILHTYTRHAGTRAV